MEIENGRIILSADEEVLTGYQSPVDIALFDLFAVQERLRQRELELRAKRAADDDELMHHERAAIIPDAFRLQRDKEMLHAMADQLIGHLSDVPVTQERNN